MSDKAPRGAPITSTPPPDDRQPTHQSWIFLALFLLSFLPFLFLDLDKASQFASALALPLAVVLAGVQALPALRRHRQPLPWRRILLFSAIVVASAGGGGVAYAVWQNVKDIPVSVAGGLPPDQPWSHGSKDTFAVPGNPPERGYLTLVTSLHNLSATGDCERTGRLDFVPFLDGKAGTPVTGKAPGQDVDVPVGGALRAVTVLVTLHYADGNESCRVSMQIDKAILHD